MSVVVVFDKLTARRLNNPANIGQYHLFINATCNPDLTKVEDVPQEYWKLAPFGRVVPMTKKERSARDRLIRKESKWGDIHYRFKPWIITKALTWAFLGVLMGVAVRHYYWGQICHLVKGLK